MGKKSLQRLYQGGCNLQYRGGGWKEAEGLQYIREAWRLREEEGACGESITFNRNNNVADADPES